MYAQCLSVTYAQCVSVTYAQCVVFTFHSSVLRQLNSRLCDICPGHICDVCVRIVMYVCISVTFAQWLEFIIRLFIPRQLYQKRCPQQAWVKLTFAPCFLWTCIYIFISMPISNDWIIHPIAQEKASRGFIIQYYFYRTNKIVLKIVLVVLTTIFLCNCLNCSFRGA